MKNLLIDGHKLNFIDINPSAQNSILFIHGNSHSHKTFLNQLKADILKDYRLVAVDLPGHGDSGFSDSYSLKSFAQILHTLIIELDLKNVLVAGHSLGGHVAINLLKHFNPKGLFLFGTPPLNNPFDPNAFLANPKAIAMSQTHSSKEEIESFMSVMNYKNEFMTSGVEDYLRSDPEFRLKIFNEIIAGTHENEFDLIKSFQGDLLILLATTDTLINNNYIRTVTGINKMQEIESGHSPHIEKSSEFNKVLADFAKSVFENKLDNKIVSLQHESSYEQRNQQ